MTGMTLEDFIGYRFRDSKLLRQALTHPSLSKEASNQRLEFLGDAVLGLLVADMLYTRFPEEDEGALARRHAALVCGETIASVARECGLGEALRMAAADAQGGGRQTPSNLEDAGEALIGALYLDGGLEAASAFVRARWERLAENAPEAPKDAKTALQEWAQGRGRPLPAYVLAGMEGPAHAPRFTIRVEVEGEQPETAEGASKRAAEQAAAARLLKRLGA